MKRQRLAIVALPFVIASKDAWAEPCSATSQCDPGLHCVHNVCTDTPADVEERWEKKLHGAFLGGALGVALPATWKTGGEAFTGSFRVGGAFLDGWQVAVDLSANLLVNQGPAAIGLFDAVATAGGLISIGENVSWIIRAGLGGGFVAGRSSPPDITPDPPLGALELRADFFGVAVRTGNQTMFELTAPSFHLVWMPSWNNDLIYMFVIGVAYDRFL